MGGSVSAAPSTSRDEATSRHAASAARALWRSGTAWLIALIGITVLVRLSFALSVPSPWILPDELLYSELARSIGEGAVPGVRGVTALGWGVVYPVLIAPAWVLFRDPVQAYHAALAINVLVMASAAIPAYLLSRCFVSRRPATVVAAVTVLVPSLAYTGVVMTENAFYPLLLWVVWLIARAVRRPTILAQLAALGGVAVLSATRVQGVVLAGALLGAAVLYAVTGPRAERVAYLRRFVPTIAVMAAIGVAAIVVLATRDSGALGGRSGTFEGLQLAEVPQWFGYLVGGLVLYVAFVPAAATGISLVRGVRREATPAERLFASVVLPVSLSLLLVVSFVSASIERENLNERYVFYLVPLLFVGLALWIESGCPRSRPSSVVVVIACAVLAAAVPIERLEFNAGFQSLALLPWLELSDSTAALAIVLGGFLVGAGVLVMRCRARDARWLWLAVGVWLTVVGVMAVDDNVDRARSYANAFSGRSATWVDDVVPRGEKVAVVWRQPAQAREPEEVLYWLMVTEMFNERLDTVYRVGPPTYWENVLPTVPAHELAGALVREDGSPLTARYVLATCRAPVDGTVVASSPYGALQLIEAKAPVRLSPSSACPRAG